MDCFAKLRGKTAKNAVDLNMCAVKMYNSGISRATSAHLDEWVKQMNAPQQQQQIHIELYRVCCVCFFENDRKVRAYIYRWQNGTYV